MMWDDGGWVLGAWVMMITLWGGLIALAVWLVCNLRSQGVTQTRSVPQTSHRRTAYQVFAERFALDEDEFSRRHRVLHSDRSASS